MSQVILPKTESEEGANEWADVFANDKAIREVVNGELDNDNIAAGAAIAASKLATPPLFGVVSSAGAKVRGSSGWTVERTETGVYKISFSPELSSSATATITMDQGTGVVIPRINGQDKKVLEVALFNLSSAAQNAQFSFHVLY